jgi:polysaccharide export outer membrane protein
VKLARTSAACLALAGFALAAVPAFAQTGIIDQLGASGAGRTVLAPTQGPPVAQALSGPVDPAEYVVGPGDILQINLSGGVNRSWDSTILPEGTLYVPSVGPIQVTGLTLVEARRAVLQRIANEYRGVAIDLRLMRPRTLLVYLAGETSQAGPHPVSAASRASEVLAEALFNDRASRRNVEIRRRTRDGETRMRIDLTRFRLTGSMASDPMLREGDVLFFPRVVSEVAIEGAVGRTGRYDLAPGDSLSTLFQLAGGLLPEATDGAVLVRFVDATHTDSLSFSAADVLAGRYDDALRPGDHVYVYFQPHYHYLEQVTIMGEVQRPGTYPLLPGSSRLSNLVVAAGGFLPTGDLASLRVFRATPQSTEADPEIERLAQLGRKEMTSSEYEVLRARVTARRPDFRVDWNRVTPGGDLDLTLRPGDIVRVDRLGASVRVEGEVRLPGLVGYEPGRRVEEYVRLAGGFSERALRGRVRVKRAVTGQTMLAKDVASLEPGDLVWVPERGESTRWQDTQAILLVLAQIATVIVAVRR